MRRIVVVILVLLALQTVSAVPVFAGTPTDSVLPVDYYDDGPHVFWKNESTAILIYVCQGELKVDTVFCRDTLRFTGACSDSGVAYDIPVITPSVEPDIYENVSKIFAVSDIHGEYHHFVDILMKSGVIDESGQWSWGEGHVVINGDVFDRGAHVTESLWLIYRLEQQAKQFGGLRLRLLAWDHDVSRLHGSAVSF